MTRSRLVVFFSFLVVAVGALGAIGAFYLDPARAAVGPLPAQGLSLPADTRFVIGVDVKRFTASPFYQKYSKNRPHSQPEALKELEDKTGLNPERDVDRVVITGRPGGEKEGAVALVQGHFDRAKLSRAIETEKKKDVTWKAFQGTTVYLFGEGAKGSGAVAFIDDDTLVVGSQAAVEATMTSFAQGSQPLRSNAALMALLEKVKPGSTFWMVGDQTLLANLPTSVPAPGAAPGPGAQGQLSLPSLKSLTITGDLDPAVALEATGEAADEAAARNLADIVRGFVAFAALQANQKPELKQLSSAISVTTDANRVLVSARFPYELIDALQPGAARPSAPEAAK